MCDTTNTPVADIPATSNATKSGIARDAESDQGESQGPFDNRSSLVKIGLTSADVFYLAAR